MITKDRPGSLSQPGPGPGFCRDRDFVGTGTITGTGTVTGTGIVTGTKTGKFSKLPEFSQNFLNFLKFYNLLNS